MKKKVAVLYAGCGYIDGTEIQEAVATLIALERHGIEAIHMAPDISQHHVVNHQTGEEMPGQRNLLVEAARITRGQMLKIDPEVIDRVDGLVIPGGFGVAKNLSDYFFKGPQMNVNPEVARCIQKAHEQNKPIAALCISPILIAKVLGTEEPTLTLGGEGQVSDHASELGALHRQTTHEEVVTDSRLKIVTGPCYMLEASPLKVHDGAENVIAEFAKLL